MCGSLEETAENLLSGSTGGGNNFGESLLDLTVSGLTGGLVGYQKDEGGLTKKGFGTRTAIGLYKDATGITAAEEANELTRQQIEEAKATAAKERADAQAANAAEQISRSRQAGAVRNSSGSVSTGSSSSNLGNMERDFLGL